MEEEKELLDNLTQTVIKGDRFKLKELAKRALDVGITPEKAIEAITEGMREVGEKFERFEYFVPEMLLSARAMKEALEILLPKVTIKREVTGRVVIGTVKGDIHDIGKTLVKTFFEIGGLEVIDLGEDVSEHQFLDAVKREKPDILAMSALLTFTMPETEKVIQTLENEGVRKNVKIIVGGAPITQEFAEKIGADGYAPNASEALKLVEGLLKVGGKRNA